MMNVIMKKTMAKQSAINVVIMHIMIPKENAKNVEPKILLEELA